MGGTIRRYAYSLDGIVSIKEVLADTSHLKTIVENAAQISEMRIINVSMSNVTKEIYKTGDQPEDDEGGWSIQAMGLISTSHIALHAWPDRNCFMFDLVSCRKFDAEKVHNLMLDLLMVKEIIHYAIFNPTSGYITPV